MGKNVTVLGAYTEEVTKARQGETGSEITDQGREADLAHDQTECESKGDPDSFNQSEKSC